MSNEAGGGAGDGAVWNPSPEFAAWKTSVRATVEASDFERHALWREFSSEAVKFWRRVDLGRIEPELGGPDRMSWSHGRVGTLALLGTAGSRFRNSDVHTTALSLNVDELDGVPVLFWYASSVLVDHDAAKRFVRSTFASSRVFCNAQNFHHALHEVQRLVRERAGA